MNNRILLVDDEETIRYVLREALVSDGYNVDIAEDAFHALEHFKLKQYDLIITDIKMHGMDGIQLIREIKRSDSRLKVIIITAYGSLETVKEAAKLGVVEMIGKPFKIQEIKNVIMRMFDENCASGDTERGKTCLLRTNDNDQLSKSDSLLKPEGLSYYFDGPACQPKSTVVFDSFAINNNKSTLIFGNINGQSDHHREWWENLQIGIMIKTLFRSKGGGTPKSVIDSINKFLYRNVLPNTTVSMLCVLVDKRKRVIQYVNSGHNLVCSMITPNGEAEIMVANPHQLGTSSEIEITEGSMPYSYENRLMLTRSNSMSKIAEEGALIKRKIENALQNIKSSQKRKAEEVNVDSSLPHDQEVSFDDETVLLINLDKNCAESSIDSKKNRLENMIGASIVTSN
ncbi:MAG: response regulator [Candidatus Brocadiales bacterium]|nr:response regulator [Candidatus Brocadiales bacterium]